MQRLNKFQLKKKKNERNLEINKKYNLNLIKKNNLKKPISKKELKSEKEEEEKVKEFCKVKCFKEKYNLKDINKNPKDIEDTIIDVLREYNFDYEKACQYLLEIKII